MKTHPSGIITFNGFSGMKPFSAGLVDLFREAGIEFATAQCRLGSDFSRYPCPCVASAATLPTEGRMPQSRSRESG